MSVLATNIKAMRKRQKLSQKALADHLDVSQTSVAHYEMGNRQPTIDTLISMSLIFNVSIDELVGNVSRKSIHEDLGSNDEIIQRLNSCLVNKDPEGFYREMTFLFEQYDFKTIIEKFLKGALAMIGLQWESGQITEADEHYATYIVRTTVNVLSQTVPKRIGLKKAIALAVNSERHTLGIEMVASYLERIGVETLYLSSNVPTRSLLRLIDEYRPDYLFISITMREHVNGLITMIDALDYGSKHRFRIFVGGQASQYAKKLLQDYGRVSIVENMDQITDLIER
jgi:methanogenic corrinoid protein MtbC1/predicted XRE-type DNA-binding protein